MVFSMLGKMISWSGSLYEEISGLMKADITRLAEGEPIAKNEKGTDAFYDFAITPASG
jgi:hypothetical protein